MLVGSIVLAAIVLKLSLYGDAGVLAILVKIQLSNNKINRRTTIIISKFLYAFNYNSTAIPGTLFIQLSEYSLSREAFSGDFYYAHHWSFENLLMLHFNSQINKTAHDLSSQSFLCDWFYWCRRILSRFCFRPFFL